MAQWLNRTLESSILHHLARGKSILLMGPRQTGKTSLFKRIPCDLSISFLIQRARLAYEKDPDQLIREVEALKSNKSRPLIMIDEVQKIPEVMDVIQYLIDEKKAQFLLTGSSARKFRQGKEINFLPGRIVQLHLDGLSLDELKNYKLQKSLLNGCLPGLVQIESENDTDNDLQSYVETFLEEEIRREAAVRNIPAFARFLELAAIEAGQICNLSDLSQQIGVAHTTIASHYQVLADCLIVERIEPLTASATRSRLIRSPRYLFFDLGVRRLAANEGRLLSPERMGNLFEQWVGIEITKLIRSRQLKGYSLHFWQDPSGPDVDWVLKTPKGFIPIEVKYTNKPSSRMAKHLAVFLEEYRSKAKNGVLICQCDRKQVLGKNIEAWPWERLPDLFDL